MSIRCRRFLSQAMSGIVNSFRAAGLEREQEAIFWELVMSKRRKQVGRIAESFHADRDVVGVNLCAIVAY